MNVLITHECSGVVREAFRALGHNAWSCDMKPSEIEADDHHLIGDALTAIYSPGRLNETLSRIPWHIIGMHPDCTFLNSAGLHWNDRGRGHEKTASALQHVRDCMDAATASAAVGWYLENPAGRIGTQIRKWDQAVQPYEFGEDASKTTGLWLYYLPRLIKDPAQYVAPRWVCKTCKRVKDNEDAQFWRDKQGVCRCPVDGDRLLPRWANQTDSGQNKLAPGPTRAADRARTYQGIAMAMAAQWGNLQPPTPGESG